MRPFVLLPLILVGVLVTGARAAVEVRIDAVGLDGYFSELLPTPVKVHVAATESQRVGLAVQVVSEWSFGERRGVSRTDKFARQLVLQAGQPIDITLPVLLRGGFSRLEAVITDEGGNELFRQRKDAESLVDVRTLHLIAIYCVAEKPCQDAQTQITFSGTTEEATKKNQQLRFVFLHDLKRPWWAYGAASTVVLAGPLSNATVEEKLALEGYLRSGARFVLLEREVSDGSFLEPYRRSPSGGKGVPVGKGLLWLVPSLEDNGLGRALTGTPLEIVVNTLTSNLYTFSQTGQLLTPPFEFPRLRWLIAWLAVYIVSIGPASFLLLRRYRRLEWGWLTMCLIAAGFAAALYIASSSNRPKEFQLDNVVIYRMDHSSGLASCEYGLRISSPRRQPVAVDIKGDAVLINTAQNTPSGHETEIASDITDKPKLQPGWDVQFGAALKVDFEMLRWSFHDLNAQGLRTFPGPVRWISPTRFKNDTGQSFTEALYVNYKENRKYALGAVAAGQEVDLGSMSFEPIFVKKEESQQYYVSMNKRAGRHSFSLSQVPYSGVNVGAARKIFAGVSDGPVLAADLQGLQAVRHNLALTLVSMDEP